MSTSTTTERSLTLLSVAEKMRHLATVEPDFVYREQPGYTVDNGCSYVGAGIGVPSGRGCIVGQALMALGVEEGRLWQLEAQEESGIPAANLLEMLDVREASIFERSIIVWISRVQSAQDTGSSWAEAVAEADRKALEVTR